MIRCDWNDSKYIHVYVKESQNVKQTFARDISLLTFIILMKSDFHNLFSSGNFCMNMDDDYEYVETLPTTRDRIDLDYTEIQFENSSNNGPPMPSASRDHSSDEERVIYSEVQGSRVYTNILPRFDSEYNPDSAMHNSGTQASAAPEIPQFKIQKTSHSELAGFNEDMSKSKAISNEYYDLDINYRKDRIPAQQNKAIKEKKKETFRDITTLRDGRMAIVSETGEIIVLSPEGKYLFSNQFDGAFENCTTVDNLEIVASCGFRVRFFSVHDTEIKEEEEKCLDFQYEETTVHGISHSEHKLLVSCNLQSVVSSQLPSLKLYDMRRKSTKTIPTFRFTYPGAVLLSSDSKSIYVADQIRKTITSLSDDGRLLWETTELCSPVSFTLVDDILAVAFETRADIKCLSSINGVFLRSVIVEATVPTTGVLLANNAKELIICPCDNSIDNVSSIVFFAPVKHAKKQPLFQKFSRMKLLSKILHK